MNRKLYYFTFSYPYGIGEKWKEAETKYFVRYFKEVLIAPFSYGRNKSPKQLPEGVRCLEPVTKYDISINSFKLRYLLHLINPRVFFYLNEFFRKKVYKKKHWIIVWLDAVVRTEKLLKSEVFRILIREDDKPNVVVYFFWGVDSSYLVPFLRKYGFDKVAVRFHGYDLYEDRNKGYIPFREGLLKNLTNAFFISDTGLEYLKTKYKHIDFDTEVYRLGAVSEGDSYPSEDNILRVFSCSGLIPLKRVEMIIEAISKLDFLIEWTHIGDGELMSVIKEKIGKLPQNLKVNLPGWVSSNEVLKFYVNQPVDLFINVSTTEGVPVTVMEAFSASIPVYATDVGGTNEIVDNSVGKLLSADLTPDILAKEIKEFYYMGYDKKLIMRNSAKKRYEEICNADVLAEELSRFLSS